MVRSYRHPARATPDVEVEPPSQSVRRVRCLLHQVDHPLGSNGQQRAVGIAEHDGNGSLGECLEPVRFAIDPADDLQPLGLLDVSPVRSQRLGGRSNCGDGVKEVVGQDLSELRLGSIEAFELFHATSFGGVGGSQLPLGLLQGEASEEGLPGQGERDHDERHRPEPDLQVELGRRDPDDSECEVADQELDRTSDPQTGHDARDGLLIEEAGADGDQSRVHQVAGDDGGETGQRQVGQAVADVPQGVEDRASGQG